MHDMLLKGKAKFVVRQSLARLGKVWQGLAKFGKVWQGLARLGNVWQGLARFGKVWPGLARFGKVWQGLAKKQIHVLTECTNTFPWSSKVDLCLFIKQ